MVRLAWITKRSEALSIQLGPASCTHEHHLFWLQVLSLVLNCQCFREGDPTGVQL